MMIDLYLQKRFGVTLISKSALVAVVVLSSLTGCSNDPPPHVPVETDSAGQQVGNSGGDSGLQADRSQPDPLQSGHSNGDEHRHSSDIEGLESDKTSVESTDDALIEVADESEESEYSYPATTVVLRSNTEGYIEWEAPVEVAYTNADITIVGPNGKRISKSFGPGENIMLDESLPDGTYQWESVISPEVTDEVRAEMQAVRNSGDSAAEQELLERFRAEGVLPTEEQAIANRQSGSFAVIGGIAKPVKVDEVKSPTEGED